MSATTFARRAVLRLVLLWLKACGQLWPRIVGAARGVYLPLGRRLVLAGLQALSASPRAVREAIMPVSLAAVGPAFGQVMFDWLHDEWHERGLLSEELGMWAFDRMKTADAVALHMIRTKDESPAEHAAAPSLADGSDFLSPASTCVAAGKPASRRRLSMQRSSLPVQPSAVPWRRRARLAPMEASQT